jgi:hypothetical protein
MCSAYNVGGYEYRSHHFSRMMNALGIKPQLAKSRPTEACSNICFPRHGLLSQPTTRESIE